MVQIPHACRFRGIRPPRMHRHVCVLGERLCSGNSRRAPACGGFFGSPLPSPSLGGQASMPRTPLTFGAVSGAPNLRRSRARRRERIPCALSGVGVALFWFAPSGQDSLGEPRAARMPGVARGTCVAQVGTVVHNIDAAPVQLSTSCTGGWGRQVCCQKMVVKRPPPLDDPSCDCPPLTLMMRKRIRGQASPWERRQPLGHRFLDSLHQSCNGQWSSKPAQGAPLAA